MRPFDFKISFILTLLFIGLMLYDTPNNIINISLFSIIIYVLMIPIISIFDIKDKNTKFLTVFGLLLFWSLIFIGLYTHFKVIDKSLLTSIIPVGIISLFISFYMEKEHEDEDIAI